MFASLISRWTIPRACMAETVLKRLRMTDLASSSGKDPRSRTAYNKSPPRARSNTAYTRPFPVAGCTSAKASRKRSTPGQSRKEACMASSLSTISCVVVDCCDDDCRRYGDVIDLVAWALFSSPCTAMAFTAHVAPVWRWTHWRTDEKAPQPIKWPVT
eukprot:scaffold130687_cov40-Prasinocladus_malaysianus.AAC.2